MTPDLMSCKLCCTVSVFANAGWHDDRGRGYAWVDVDKRADDVGHGTGSCAERLGYHTIPRLVQIIDAGRVTGEGLFWAGECGDVGWPMIHLDYYRILQWPKRKD